MATVQTIVDNARLDFVKFDPGKVIVSDASMIRYLNEALTVFYTKTDFKFRFKDGTITPLVAGTANYTPATDLGKLLWAKLVDGDADSTQVDETLLENVTDVLADWQQGRDMDYQDDAPGYIYEEDSVFKLWPIPNAAAAARYTIKYKYSEVSDTLVAGNTPSFPSRWHYILGYYIAYKVYDSMPGPQNSSLAEKYYNEWERKLKMAMHDILARQGEHMTYMPLRLPSKKAK